MTFKYNSDTLFKKSRTTDDNLSATAPSGQSTVIDLMFTHNQTEVNGIIASKEGMMIPSNYYLLSRTLRSSPDVNTAHSVPLLHVCSQHKEI